MKPLLIPAILLLAMPITAEAELIRQEIDYAHGEAQLRGYLVYDDAVDGPRPGVLVVHEWWGLDDYARQRAEQLAELGYVAFALDMYGRGIRTDDPARAMELSAPFAADRRRGRDRALAGLAVLQEHELVDRERIAAIGYCFGGTVALELARDGADLAGVVSFHGALLTPQPAEPQAVRAKVLVLHGAADPLVPPEHVDQFIREMTGAGADWQLISYGGAVHSFTNPEADRHNLPGVAYDEAADRRSWEHMKVFFGEVFSD